MGTCNQLLIDEVISCFFSAFDNRTRALELDQLKGLFIRGAIIVKRSDLSMQSMCVEKFVEPRKELLSNGTLIDFHEWELEQKTFISLGIASRLSRYSKEGLLNGQSYTGRGEKHFQLVLTEQGWKIASILWQDEL
jgi:hypothetical protein